MKKKLSKKERLLRYRKQNRLPKYDIAMKKTSTGAQDFTYNPVQTSLTPGVDISGDIKSAKQKILPNALSTATSAFTLSNSLTKGLETLGLKSTKQLAEEIGQKVTKNAVNMTAEAAAKAGEKATEEALKSGTSNIISQSGSSGLSSAAGVANILAGAYNAYKTIAGISGMGDDYRSAQDMVNTSSKQIVYRNGVPYEYLGGIDAASERRYASTQNTNDIISNTLSGAGAGFSVGTVVPVIGNVLGAILGGALGFLGSAGGADKREEHINEAIERATRSIEATNRQNESLAATQGLRQQFYQTHAGNSGYLNANRGYNPSNSGIVSYDEVGRPEGETKVVWTPEGKQVDKQGSWVGKGESLIDYTTGKATVVKEGKVGVDNQPSSAKEGDTITIAGNDVNWKTGNTFAREVAPYALMIEGLNKTERAVQNSKASQKTKEINMLNLKRAKEPYLTAAKQLTDQQDMQHKIENMYRQQLSQSALPQYSLGKFWKGTKNVLNKIGASLDKGASGIAQYAPYLMNAMAATRQYYDYKNSTPTARNSYVANAYAPSALNALASLYYDPSAELSAARDAYRNQLYLNNNAGSLSAGQRAALNNALGIGLMKSRSAILQNAQNKMNEYKEKYATQALTTGNEEAARRQNALAAYNTQLANAYAARLKGMETAQKSLGNIFEMFGKHVFDSDQYRRALDIQGKQVRLYDNG